MKTAEKGKTFLGFDYGRRFLGVAVGQTVTRTAKPLMTLKAEKGVPQWSQVQELVHTWKPAALIVGWPLNMDGTAQFTTEEAEQFVAELSKRFQLQVYTVDERLTTVEAKARLFEQGGYKALDKSKIDAVSAQIILEAWMSENEL